MSITEARALAAPGSFLHDYLGKKFVMAVSGVALFGFVVGHMLGNLQVFLGPAVMNEYGEMLRANPLLLWGTRGVVLAAVVLHVWAAVALTAAKRAARPLAYSKWRSRDSTYSSRTMMWSGPIVGVYLVYHLLHLTYGTAHADFEPGNVYRNVVIGFSSPVVSLVYIVAMVMLGLHLRHGIWSMFQTVGFNHPRYTPRLRTIAAVTAVAIVVGYVSIPIAVLTGVIGLE